MTHTQRPDESSQASRVLLVDARDDLCLPLTESLEAAGFAVERVEQALLALRRLGERAHDAVLLGVDADGLDAARLAERLAPACTRPSQTLVMLVDGDDPDLVRRGFESGARDFLVVPAELALAGERTLFALRVAGERADLDRMRSQVDLVQSASQLGLWHWDRSRESFSASPLACELFGFERGRGTFTLDELLLRSAEGARAALGPWLSRAEEGGSVSCLRHRLQAGDGVERVLGLESMGGPRCAGAPLFGVVRELTERRGARVLPSDETDSLTGLSTRERFVGELDRALVACGKSGSHLAVLCLDLNQFKAISGAFSREAGDQLLVQIALRLREGLRSHDLLAHLGCDPSQVSIARIRGDEFTILLPDLKRAADAVKVGKRVLEMLTEPFKLAQQEVFVTVSIGIASFPTDDADAEQLLKCSETAAYCARQQGRNTVLYYSPAMNAKAFERLTLETGLRRALERDELIVHYQPRVDIASGRPVGFEALVRWRHPELGLVSPAQFIPLAEETGLIVPIGEWILEHACAQARRWQEAGLPFVRMAVNLSSVQFRQPDLFETVQAALERSRLEPRWLELELTESLLMQNPENAVLTLQRLAARGIHLSIDDFGTGYSSLSYLKRFPIHSLKIDQTFIRELTTNPDDAAIATSIILMGKSLKLRVVAEGVETRSQLSFLRVMQCHEAQGYLFSPPVSAQEAEAFLRKGGPLLEDAA
jgi:diguanylate cyclase (GGDEF)-like protein